MINQLTETCREIIPKSLVVLTIDSASRSPLHLSSRLFDSAYWRNTAAALIFLWDITGPTNIFFFFSLNFFKYFIFILGFVPSTLISCHIFAYSFVKKAPPPAKKRKKAQLHYIYLISMVFLVGAL